MTSTLTPRKFVPADVRHGRAVNGWLRSFDDLCARHEQHKADIASTEARLDRVGRRLNQEGV